MNNRTVTAFLVAPLVAAILFASVSRISSGSSSDLLELLVTIAVVFFYAGAGTVALALPAFAVLRRLGLVRWWSALAAGATLGLLFDLLIFPWSSPWLRGHLGIPAIGAISGFSFWLVWRRDTSPNYRLDRP